MLDVKCPDDDTMASCSDAALRLLDRAAATPAGTTAGAPAAPGTAAPAGTTP